MPHARPGARARHVDPKPFQKKNYRRKKDGVDLLPKSIQSITKEFLLFVIDYSRSNIFERSAPKASSFGFWIVAV